MRSVKLQGKEAVVAAVAVVEMVVVVVLPKMPRESPSFQERPTYTLSLDRTP
jgi:hypothetical protein